MQNDFMMDLSDVEKFFCMKKILDKYTTTVYNIHKLFFREMRKRLWTMTMAIIITNTAFLFICLHQA